MTLTSRWPGFYSLSLDSRQQKLADEAKLDGDEVALALRDGGLQVAAADKCVENVIGTYALPFAVALNVQINGRDRVAPMVIEEPSVVAACSYAAKLVRAGGGFIVETDEPIMIAQVQFEAVADTARAGEALLRERAALIKLADRAVPGLVTRGGGTRDIILRDLGDGWAVVHILVDCQDAMGANLVNNVAEALAPELARIIGGKLGLRILSNLADERCVRVRARVPIDALGDGTRSGESVRDGIISASRFAERDPYRAATHNKGIMNGVDAVVLATGNDWRAVEAGAHAYAARSGKYRPLCTWRLGEDGALIGDLEMPMALGVVGGFVRIHEGAQLALRIAKIESAQDLAALAASAGVASNLAALRALATVGIQQGHMALHARSVALAAGAEGDEVDRVAAEIHSARDVTVEAARRAIAARARTLT